MEHTDQGQARAGGFLYLNNSGDGVQVAGEGFTCAFAVAGAACDFDRFVSRLKASHDVVTGPCNAATAAAASQCCGAVCWLFAVGVAQSARARPLLLSQVALLCNSYLRTSMSVGRIVFPAI